MTKRIPADRHLLDKVTIKGAKEQQEVLLTLSKQHPNRKVLGVFKYNLWLYNRAERFGYIRAREKKIAETSQKLQNARMDVSKSYDDGDPDDVIAKKNKVVSKYERKLESQTQKYEEFKTGLEHPVLMDTFLAHLSSAQMNRYLFDQGYFKSVVTYSVKEKRKKAFLTYSVQLNNRYFIRKVKTINADRRIDSILLFDTSMTLVKKGYPYAISTFDAERLRIENVLQNHGYYLFKHNAVKFKMDTIHIVGDSVDVDVSIENPTPNRRHRRFILDTVQIEFNNPYNPDSIVTTTSMIYNGLKFKSDKPFINADVLSDLIFLRSNTEFKRIDRRNTETRLNQIRFIKFADVNFKVDTSFSKEYGKLYTTINLTPQKKYLTNIDAEFNRTDEIDRTITNNLSNYYGIAGSTYLLNRNVGRKALLFETRLRGTVEMHFDSIYKLSFNRTVNYQLGLINSLTFPEILVPWKLLRKVVPKRIYDVERLRRLNSQTSINLNVLYERNINFDRVTGNLNYTYQFIKGKNRYFYTPLEVSLISATPALGFVVPDDPLIKNLFDKHIITDGRFTWLINQQPITTVSQRYYYFRNSIEVGGFLPLLYDKSVEKITNDQGLIFGNKYYNYVKIESDYRLYIPIAKKTNLAMRLASGFGFPYFGTSILPYEKRFYVGGANSLRAWRARSLGPGSFIGDPSVAADRSGDFKIEGSAELRFPFYKFLNGAMFMDFGNVWVSKNDGVRNGATFTSKFYQEMALSPGFGLRFDFSFFVIRFDAGWKMYNPQNPLQNRWFYEGHRDELSLKKTNLNIGIGYPF